MGFLWLFRGMVFNFHTLVVLFHFINFYFDSIVIRKYTLHDFSLLKFMKTCFVAYNIICSRNVPCAFEKNIVSTWVFCWMKCSVYIFCVKVLFDSCIPYWSLLRCSIHYWKWSIEVSNYYCRVTSPLNLVNICIIYFEGLCLV